MRKLFESLLSAILIFLIGILFFVVLFFPAILSAILFKTNILPYTQPIAIFSAIISTIWLMTGIIFITADDTKDYWARNKEN